MIHWTSLNYVVVNVEGNGHQPPDLVELAAVPLVGGIIGEPKTRLVKPDQPITGSARGVLMSQPITNAGDKSGSTLERMEPLSILLPTPPCWVWSRGPRFK